MHVPEIPDRPAKEEAEVSLKYLKATVADLPFANEADRSAWLACLITAPVMASGKTLLAMIPDEVVTGWAPSMLSQAEDLESERKRILTILLEDDAVAVIDNVERPLGSDAYCSVLTGTSYCDRLLGQTMIAEVPTTTTWYATGNNSLRSAPVRSV